jgi:hypothetical protein
MASWFEVELTAEHVPSSSFVVEVVAEHVQPPHPEHPEHPGGGRPHVHSGGPIEQRFRHTISGDVVWAKKLKAVFSGDLEAQQARRFTFVGELVAGKPYSETFSGTRENSPHLARIAREDEEILLSL